MLETGILMDRRNKTIAEQRATASREVEYLRNMTESTSIGDRFLEVEELSSTYDESVDLEETKEIMDHFTSDGDEGKSEEIDRILNSKTDMSFDEMLGIQNDIGQAYESAFMNDYYFEGVNIDYGRVRKMLKKNTKQYIKLMKKDLNAGKYDSAKKNLANARNELKEAKKEFDKIEKNLDSDTIPSTVISYFYYYIVEQLKSIALAILTLPVGGLGGVIYAMYQNITSLVALIKGIVIDVKKDDISPNTFNVMRSRAKLAFDSTENLFDKVEKIIDETKKVEKNLKESGDDMIASGSNTKLANDKLDKAIDDVDKKQSNQTSEPNDNSLSMTEDEMIDELFGDLYEEGANKDLMDIRKRYINPSIKKVKSAKQMIKNGDSSAAKKLLNDVIDDMNAVKNVISNTDDTNIEKMIGRGLVGWKSLVLAIAGTIAFVSGSSIALHTGSAIANKVALGGYSTVLASAFASLNDMEKATSGVKKLMDKKLKTGEDKNNTKWTELLTTEFNVYRAATYQMADECMQVAKKLINEIDNGNIFEQIEKNKKGNN